MHVSKKVLVALLGVPLLLVTACSSSGSSSSSGSGTTAATGSGGCGYTFAVITHGDNGSFWSVVYKGAKDAASALGCKLSEVYGSQQHYDAMAGRPAPGVPAWSGEDFAAMGAFMQSFNSELAESGDRADRAVVGHSMRNRFSGLVSRVVRDTVMAQVEIQAGPHRFVSLLSREAADELGLEPGVLAVAAIKATNVSIEIPAVR